LFFYLLRPGAGQVVILGRRQFFRGLDHLLQQLLELAQARRGMMIEFRRPPMSSVMRKRRPRTFSFSVKTKLFRSICKLAGLQRVLIDRRPRRHLRPAPRLVVGEL